MSPPIQPVPRIDFDLIDNPPQPSAEDQAAAQVMDTVQQIAQHAQAVKNIQDAAAAGGYNRIDFEGIDQATGVKPKPYMLQSPYTAAAFGIPIVGPLISQWEAWGEKKDAESEVPTPSEVNAQAAFERAPSGITQFWNELYGTAKQFALTPVRSVANMIGAPVQWMKTTATHYTGKIDEDAYNRFIQRGFAPDAARFYAELQSSQDFLTAQRSLVALAASSVAGYALGPALVGETRVGSGMLTELAQSELPRAAWPMTIPSSLETDALGTVRGLVAGAATFPLAMQAQEHKLDLPSASAMTLIGLGIGGVFHMGEFRDALNITSESSKVPNITEPVTRAVFNDMWNRARPSVNDEPPPPNMMSGPELYVQGAAAREKVNDLVQANFNVQSALIYHADRVGEHGTTVLMGVEHPGDVIEGAREVVRARITPAQIATEEEVLTNGARLHETIYDPSKLDSQGRPVIIARAGDMITPEIIEQMREAGLDTPTKTSAGLLSIETRPITADDIMGTPMTKFKNPNAGILPTMHDIKWEELTTPYDLDNMLERIMSTLKKGYGTDDIANFIVDHYSRDNNVSNKDAADYLFNFIHDNGLELDLTEDQTSALAAILGHLEDIRQTGETLTTSDIFGPLIGKPTAEEAAARAAELNAEAAQNRHRIFLEKLAEVKAEYGVLEPRGLKSGLIVDADFAIHPREDGFFDVAIMGHNSPLNNMKSRDIFHVTGFFPGQELYYKGKPWVFTGDYTTEIGPEGEEISTLPILKIKNASGQEIWMAQEALLHPTYTRVGEPVAMDIVKGKVTPQEAADILKLQLVNKEMSDAIHTQVVGFVDQTLRHLTQANLEPIPGAKFPELKLQPGMNILAFPPTYTEMGTFGEVKGEQEVIPTYEPSFSPKTPTTYVWADKDGKPVGFMQITQAFDPTAGTFKQILKGEEPRSKFTTQLGTFIIDPTFDRMTSGRAAVELLRKADELGVTKIDDEAYEMLSDNAAKVAAHFINKYRGGAYKSFTRFGVGGASLDVDAIWNDFKSVSDDIDATAERYGKTLPDINDIRKKYPTEVDNALLHLDPDEAMWAFADYMSRYVESGEINPDIAESMGTRMQQYLEQRYNLELFRSFDARVRYFMKVRGFVDEEFNGVYRYLATRLGKELRDKYVPEDERMAYESAVNGLFQLEGKGAPPNIRDMAAGAGLQLTYSPTGSIIIRSGEDGTLMAVADNEDGVRQFISKSGQPDGVSLDGGGRLNSVPPGAVGGDAMPPADTPPPEAGNVQDEMTLPPYEDSHSRLEKVLNWYRVTAPWFSRMGSVFNAMDVVWGRNLFDRVFNPLQRAHDAMVAARYPYEQMIINAAKKFGKGLTKEQNEMIFQAVQQMTPEEIIDHAASRKMTETEINAAKWFAANEIDLRRIFQYLREEQNIKMYVPKYKQVQAYKDLEAQFNFDDDHRAAASLITAIKGRSRDEADLGLVTRLAYAIQENSVDRNTYMLQNKFTPQMRQAVDWFDEFWDLGGKLADIDAKRMINGYMPHLRAFGDAADVQSAWLWQKGLEKVPEIGFLSEMARMGERTVYERNPWFAAQRYIRSWARSRYFEPVMDEALRAANEELNALPGPAQPRGAAIINSYMKEITGAPNAAVQFTQEATDKTIEQLHLNIAPEVRHDAVDTITSLMYSSGVGLRAGIVLKHVNQFLTLGFSSLGPKAVMRAWSMIPLAKRMAPDLRLSGVIPTIGPSQFLSGREFTEDAITRALNGTSNFTRGVADFSMRANGLKTVFELSHATWYLERKTAFSKAASDYVRDVALGGDPVALRQALYQDQRTNLLKTGEISEIDNAFRTGNYELASHLQGMAWGRKLTFVYGAANHPMGWGTNVGRLVGMYGVWPTWMQDYFLDGISRGTMAQRVGFMTRFATAQGVTKIMATALGLDLGGFYMVPGMIWSGGPALAFLNTLIGAARDPSPGMRDEYRRRLGQYLPWNNIQQLYIPFSGLASDLYHATNDPEVDNLVKFLARAAGIRVAQQQSDLGGVIPFVR